MCKESQRRRCCFLEPLGGRGRHGMAIAKIPISYHAGELSVPFAREPWKEVVSKRSSLNLFGFIINGNGIRNPH